MTFQKIRELIYFFREEMSMTTVPKKKNKLFADLDIEQQIFSYPPLHEPYDENISKFLLMTFMNLYLNIEKNKIK